MSGVDGFTKFLCHFNGVDGAQAYTAETGQVITFVNSAQLDIAQKKFGTSSLLLERDTDDYITTPLTDDLKFGSGDFTIDLQFRPVDLTGNYQVLVGCGNSGSDYFRLYVESGEIKAYAVGVITGLVTSGAGLTAGNWYHVVFERYGSNWNLYVNGQKLGTASSATAWTNYPGNLCFGGLYYNTTMQAGYEVDGWLDEIRISKGIARYQGANFVSPIRAYGQTPGGIILI